LEPVFRKKMRPNITARPLSDSVEAERGLACLDAAGDPRRARWGYTF
jgi:hypothetical protein